MKAVLRAEIDCQIWDGSQALAAQIIDWCSANGGEARYEPRNGSPEFGGQDPCIVLRGPDGPTYVYPGGYAVKGTGLIPGNPGGSWKPPIREFYAVSDLSQAHPTLTVTVGEDVPS